MSKCPAQKKKKRVSTKRRSNPGDYKRPYKGHQWVGHGENRRCKLCGCRPK